MSQPAIGEHSHDADAIGEGRIVQGTTAANLDPRSTPALEQSKVDNQSLDQNERAIQRLDASVEPPQQLSADQQRSMNLPSDMRRSEQVRLKVLESTRAYLGVDAQLIMNSPEPRADDG